MAQDEEDRTVYRVVLNHEEGNDASGKPAVRHQMDLILHTESRAVSLATRLFGASAPRMAEEYVGQMEMFFGALAWYLTQHPDKATTLFEDLKRPSHTAPTAPERGQTINPCADKPDLAARERSRPGNQVDERGLARAHGSEEPQPTPGIEVALDVLGEPSRGGDDAGVDVRDRGPVEGDVPVLAGDDGREAPGLALSDALSATAAVVSRVAGLVIAESGPVAEGEGAGLLAAAGVGDGDAHPAHPAKRSPAKFMNLGYSLRKVSTTSPTGPLRCLAMMMSASPGRSESRS